MEAIRVAELPAQRRESFKPTVVAQPETPIITMIMAVLNKLAGYHEKRK
jgi:hypothetical protein